MGKEERYVEVLMRERSECECMVKIVGDTSVDPWE